MEESEQTPAEEETTGGTMPKIPWLEDGGFEQFDPSWVFFRIIFSFQSCSENVPCEPRTRPPSHQNDRRKHCRLFLMPLSRKNHQKHITITLALMWCQKTHNIPEKI